MWAFLDMIKQINKSIYSQTYVSMQYCEQKCCNILLYGYIRIDLHIYDTKIFKHRKTSIKTTAQYEACASPFNTACIRHIVHLETVSFKRSIKILHKMPLLMLDFSCCICEDSLEQIPYWTVTTNSNTQLNRSMEV